jgi:hypothetical protein
MKLSVLLQRYKPYHSIQLSKTVRPEAVIAQ